MSTIAFAIPGDIDLPTGGYAYDRRLLAEWRAMDVPAEHVPLPGSFPFPTEADLHETGRALLQRPYDDTLLIDGLAYGAFPEGIAAGLADRVVALVHHPLALETGLAPEMAQRLRERETAALRYVRAVVTTSPATKRLLISDFGVPEARIAVALPGVDPAPRATGSAEGRPLHLLAVGSVVPRKGYRVLVEALAGLRDRDWRLTIVGATDRSPETMRDLVAAIDGRGSGRTDRTCRRHPGRCPRRSLCPHGPLRDALALRRLWHGADGGARPWPADRLHHRRCGGGDRAGRCGPESRTRRRRRSCQGPGKPD